MHSFEDVPITITGAMITDIDIDDVDINNQAYIYNVWVAALYGEIHVDNPEVEQMEGALLGDYIIIFICGSSSEQLVELSLWTCLKLVLF